MALSLATLLHILVLVYWLGGDLGAYYASRFLTDHKRAVPERMLALTILNNIDMAPRSALILALPTGVLLGWLKGWLEAPAWLPLVIGVASLGWLALAWRVHLTHGAAPGLKRLDIAVRWIVLALLLGVGVAGIAGAIALPLFIAGKLIVLAACVGLGLLVRRQLVPLFAPIREMAATGATPATDAAIDGVLGQTRPTVMVIWALLLVAAYLGIATPV